MTGTQDQSASRRDGIELLREDLTFIAGTLSEIATAWRRAKSCLPALPLGLPVQLQDIARQLASEIEGLAAADPLQPSARALSAAHHFSALEEGIASARAMTRGPGIPGVEDGRLWESLSAPLRRVGARLTGLGPRPAAAGG